MSIEKRSTRQGNRWCVRYRENGGNRRRTFDSRKDAEAYEAQVRLAMRTGSIRALDGGQIELADFGEKWWAEYVKPRLATATRHSYSHAWNHHVVPYLGNRPLREITPRIVDSWRVELERSGLGAPTVRKSMAVLQSCMQRAVVWDEISTNPCREVRKPTGKRNRVIEPLTPMQVESMRQHLISDGKHRDATLISVLAYAGLRPSEALALDWRHIRKKTVLVERSVSFGELKDTKTGKVRSVQLCAALAHDLKLWRMRCGATEGLVFPSRQGTPWLREAQKSWERKTFKDAAKAAGVPSATPYALRHSFASLLIHEGRSIVEVAAQLGHAPTMTLDTYAHVFADLDARVSMGDQIAEARRKRAAGTQSVPNDDAKIDCEASSAA